MKKVICLIDGLGSGGAERQLCGLAVLLKQQGYDVEVWYYHPTEFYLSLLDDNCVPHKYIKGCNGIFNKIKFIQREIRHTKPHTVIAYMDGASIVGCISKLLGSKFRLIVSERNTTQKIRMRDRIKFLLYRYADYIVPNSYSQTRFIETNYPQLSNKTKTITNFVDTDKFSFKESLHRNSADKLTILTVGRVMHQKNVLNYITAIKRLVDKGYNIHIKWIGNQSIADYFQECQERILEFGLTDYFSFMQPTANVVSEYHGADIFCLPSIYEGYPNVICEAMSCGLPIACSNVCDNGEIVSEGTNGVLFNPNNVDDISNAIERIIDFYADRGYEISINNRNKMLKNNSSESFVRKYTDLINS